MCPSSEKPTATPSATLKLNCVQQQTFTVDTGGRGTVGVTRQIAQIVRQSGVSTGIAQVFTHHTSCSLLITENADPRVRDDLERYFGRLVRDGDPMFEHDDEGPDDMSAHVRAALTSTHLAIPVTRGAPALGTWQGIYLWEHRTHAHQRRVTVTVIGNAAPAG